MILVVITLFFMFICAVLMDSILFLMAFILVYSVIMSITLIYTGMAWFALLFYLVYVSGILVLFGYTIAMSPNMVTPLISEKYLAFGVVIFLLPKLEFLDGWGWETYTTDYSMDIVGTLSYTNLTMYLMMTVLLLISLLAVVNITYKAPSPLRPYL